MSTMLHKVDPFATAVQPLLPCDVYPFVAGKTPLSFAKARTKLKLSCLLHDRLTIPGSLALQDPFVRGLSMELLPFIKSGQLCLDLRSSCHSFNDLAVQKHEELVPHATKTMADILDATCPQVISFDEKSTSSNYSAQLASVTNTLLMRTKSSSVAKKLESAIETLNKSPQAITLDIATSLMKGTYLGPRFSAVAKLLYSLEGARVTNANPIVPAELWAQAFPTRASLVPESIPNPGRQLESDRLQANDIVFDYFSIDAAHIDRLTAEEILELKHEPMTSRYIRELDLAIGEAASQIRSGSPFDDALEMARDRAKYIELITRQRCEREKRLRKREAWFTASVDEIGGATADLIGVSLVRKGLAKLARRVARNNKSLAWVDYTTAPLFAHVSRFHESVSGRV